MRRVSLWSEAGAGRGRGAGVRPACLLGRGHTLCPRQGPEPRGHVHPARADRPPFNTPERPGAQGRGGGGGGGKCGHLPQGRESWAEAERQPGRKGIIQNTSLHCLGKEKKIQPEPDRHKGALLQSGCRAGLVLSRDPRPRAVRALSGSAAAL